MFCSSLVLPAVFFLALLRCPGIMDELATICAIQLDVLLRSFLIIGLIDVELLLDIMRLYDVDVVI